MKSFVECTVDLIKIDAEGLELEVLAGLTKNVPVLSPKCILTSQDMTMTRS